MKENQVLEVPQDDSNLGAGSGESEKSPKDLTLLKLENEIGELEGKIKEEQNQLTMWQEKYDYARYQDDYSTPEFRSHLYGYVESSKGKILTLNIELQKREYAKTLIESL